jgi:hypothetical protein
MFLGYAILNEMSRLFDCFIVNFLIKFFIDFVDFSAFVRLLQILEYCFIYSAQWRVKYVFILKIIILSLTLILVFTILKVDFVRFLVYTK